MFFQLQKAKEEAEEAFTNISEVSKKEVRFSKHFVTELSSHVQRARISLYLRGSGSVRLIKWWKDTESIDELIGYWRVEGT